MTNLELAKVVCDEIDSKFTLDKTLAARYPQCPAANRHSCQELLTFVKHRPRHDRHYAICADKPFLELGFKPRTSLTNGLVRAVDRYIANESWWRSIRDGSYREDPSANTCCEI